MRKDISRCLLLGIAMLCLVCCTPDEQETMADKAVLDEVWTLSYESLNGLTPMTVSAETFRQVAVGKYYCERLYTCSGSPGHLCIWDDFNELTTDMASGGRYANYEGYYWTLYRFDDESRYAFGSKMSIYPDLIQMKYWYFNETNGTLSLASHPIEESNDIVGFLTLMKIASNYIVWREAKCNTAPEENATFMLHVYELRDEKTARKKWNVNI